MFLRRTNYTPPAFHLITTGQLTMLTPRWIPESIQHWTRPNIPKAQNLQHSPSLAVMTNISLAVAIKILLVCCHAIQAFFHTLPSLITFTACAK